MAGTLTISTLSDGTNSTSSTNCIQGSAKAWVNFNGSTQAVRGSYNVSSITLVATGQFTVNYTSALPNVNYSIQVTASSVASGTSPTFASIYESGTISTSGTTVQCNTDTGATRNPLYVYVAVFSS